MQLTASHLSGRYLFLGSRLQKESWRCAVFCWTVGPCKWTTCFMPKVSKCFHVTSTPFFMLAVPYQHASNPVLGADQGGIERGGGPSPASTTSCMHLVSISKFHPPRAIVSNKNHKQDNVSEFVGNLCELEGPRCLNRSTLGWGTLRVGLYGCNLHAAKCVKMSEAKTTSTIAGDETVLVSWELLKGLRLRDKCRCEGTYCYCFLSCINFVSYVDFPYWPLRHFLRFCCCNIRTSPASTTSCMHLVSISKFHPPRAIVSNKNHKQDNVSQFVGHLCELEGPRCLNRSTLGWGTLRVGLYGCNLHAAKCVKMSEAKTTSTIAGDETVLVSWELLKGLRLRDKCRCEGTYCYCFLI